MKNIAIYSRKSKVTETGDSINNQINLCKSFAEFRFSEEDIQFNLYCDEGFSGGNIERPMFAKLLNDIENQIIDVLICYRLDRISRNVADFSAVLRKMEKHNVIFISVSENFDTNSAMGRAMIYISSVFAQLERDTISERISDNLFELAKSGQRRYLNGTAPEGFKKIRKKNNENKYFSYLETDESETFKIELIFNKYLELKTLGKVADFCEMNNLKTRRSSIFSKDSIRRILTNPIYSVADLNIYNYYKNKNAFFANGKKLFDGNNGLYAFGRYSKKTTGFENWIIGVGHHKGIISSDTFIKVQDLIIKKARKSK